MPGTRPNILLILNDDMGYSDIGCYGGEVHTPNLDSLAASGVRFTQAYNTARCCPSRASLLTGLHPHQTGVGWMTYDWGLDGYRGDLNDECVTVAEGLRAAGYATYMSGKWHVTRNIEPHGPMDAWPCQRGFDRYWGTLSGASSYFTPKTLTEQNDPADAPREGFYLTSEISDHAVDFIRSHDRQNRAEPFFLYTAYTAPHWPLHALEEDMERYRGRFDAGWDVLREERYDRMTAMGLIDESWRLTERDEAVVPWKEAGARDWQRRRMEVYAAQIDRMDRGIGRIIDALKDTGQLDNTLIIFLADNGGCAEELNPDWTGKWNIISQTTHDGEQVIAGNRPEIMPGDESTYQSYGIPWANLSNTPFRLYKHWTHEGGIATPLIVHWPNADFEAAGELVDEPVQLPDISATVYDAAGAEYPDERQGVPVQSLEGFSFLPVLRGHSFDREALFLEHEGNCAVRMGRWKLVRRYPGPWELYDMVADRTETNDLARAKPDMVTELSDRWQDWAQRCRVVAWDEANPNLRDDG